MLVKIQYPENPRFPLEGSSAEGQSGPKIRLKSVVDGKQVNIPVLFIAGVKGDETNGIILNSGSQYSDIRKNE